ncbi:MAE_28990/MAE_18760 family HEPN-like nuclease [Fischerella sp. PCC 9605]|uniref:MAE_28990/MAE_18760 family HEPN-like nuclease n=1 Tax=Fischerella sp. PCC 9605 TaxID=1173024 RepID=UPI0004B7CBDD|nr:MAE_28990/MAE_18760 family HEPN-like nuclease [Fischerella sp. PCC 9605]
MTTKIRTQTQLYDRLSEEIAWRRKELIYIKSVIEKNRYTAIINTLIRSGIPILYAHWEGFVKNAATSYIEFVARQNLKYEELACNFIALAMKTKLKNAQESNKSTIFVEVANFFRTGLSEKCYMQWENAVNTQSNLSSVIFKDIICCLGLDYSIYETKEKLIDEKLLRSRNEIAHGKELLIDYEQYIELHDEVINLINLFFNQIDNAASTKSYLHKNYASVHLTSTP